jgi:hypothetical protein
LTGLPKVPWDQRLGDISEAEIKKRLSYFSIVNKYNLDIGLDFYCELLEDDSPTTSFYVQAKGTEHFDSNWGASIKKSTIRYWLDKLFPVYLVVNDENNRNCYWMSIEDHRYDLLDKLLTGRETVYINMDRNNVLEAGRDRNSSFISKIKDDQLSIALWQGRPRPKGEDYVKKIPSPPRSGIELLRLKANMRMTLYSLVQHYIAGNNLETARLCSQFLADFDKDHYNHFVWLGKINKKLCNSEEAKQNFVQALSICDRDTNWPKESMDKLKEEIQKEIENT